MKYKIISAPSDEELMEEVNKKLNQGWVLQGGVGFRLIVNENEWMYYQAMVLKS